jgi:hypothetical protein
MRRLGFLTWLVMIASLLMAILDVGTRETPKGSPIPKPTRIPTMPPVARMMDQSGTGPVGGAIAGARAGLDPRGRVSTRVNPPSGPSAACCEAIGIQVEERGTLVLRLVAR